MFLFYFILSFQGISISTAYGYLYYLIIVMTVSLFLISLNFVINFIYRKTKRIQIEKLFGNIIFFIINLSILLIASIIYFYSLNSMG